MVKFSGRWLTGLAVLGLSLPLLASEADLRAEMEKLKKEVESLQGVKKEVEELRKKDAASKPVGTGVVDKVVSNKYGPNASVTTKAGKLTIGGLVHVWYQSIENDNLGFFGDLTRGVVGGGDTNEGRDNDTFAIRRAELKFTMDIHENVTAVVMIDGAGNWRGRQGNTNLGTSLRAATTTTADQTAATSADGGYAVRLQDAYINYHDFIPHHDFTVGQFKPYQSGIEGSASKLDFVERSMIGILSDARDVGIQVHGTWLDDRLQYWFGGFNTPTSYLAPAQHDRVDNNDAKSFTAHFKARPVWKNETWGSLELGFAAAFNFLGESERTLTTATDGLSQLGTEDIRYNAYAIYQPGGPVKGWWLKGEYAWFRSRLPSQRWAWDAAAGAYEMTGATQTIPGAYDTDGWFVSTGYKISDSIFAGDVPCWFKPFEFAFRYETFGNIQVADLVYGSRRHDVWSTSIYTAGVNYYIKGDNAKIQVNYNWVNEPNQDHDGGTTPRLIREVNNDNLMVNFQVCW